MLLQSLPVLLSSPGASLSAEETSRLRQLERIVQEGLDSFLKDGGGFGGNSRPSAVPDNPRAMRGLLFG
jgi:hypothetical protein